MRRMLFEGGEGGLRVSTNASARVVAMSVAPDGLQLDARHSEPLLLDCDHIDVTIESLTATTPPSWQLSTATTTFDRADWRP